MAYIVGDSCVKCKYTDCVAVCPVDCFYEGENFLIIHPDECIDCGACEPECPVTAIYEEGALPEEWKPYIEINSVFSGAMPPEQAEKEGWPEALVAYAEGGDFEVWPNINEKKDALPGADDMAKAEGKLADLSPKGGS